MQRCAGSSIQRAMKLSVVVPVYNGRNFICRCIRSIAAQTFRDMEVIVVDDGSTDGTAELLRAMKEAEPVMRPLKLRIIRQENQGTSSARMSGVHESSGEWIAFVDSDDWIEPDFYERLFTALDEQAGTGADISIVCCGITEENGNCVKLKGGRQAQLLDRRHARLSMLDKEAFFANVYNKIYRRELLAGIDLPDGNPVGEDLDMVLQILDKADMIFCAEGNGYHYIRRRGSQTLRRFGEEKRQGYLNSRRIEKDFTGSREERDALARYLMIEYVSCLLLMYRSKVRDREMEREILRFVREHRRDFIRNSGDGFAAKACIALLDPLSSGLFYAIWPRRY